MKSSLLLFLVYSAVVFCDCWNKSYEISDDPRADGAIYINQKTLQKHVFYTKVNTSAYLCYFVYDAEMNFVREGCLNQMQNQPLRVAVAGTKNGSSITLVYEAIRQFGEKMCNSENNDGCRDIYFTESVDGGYSFASVLPVPRHKMSDSINRENGYVKYVDFSDGTFQVFITFRINPTGILWITRNSKSLNFTKEVIIKRTRYSNYQFETLNSQSGPTLHVFCYDSSLSIYKFTSDDLGISWDENPIFKADDEDEFFVGTNSDKSVLFFPILKKQYYMIYTLTFAGIQTLKSISAFESDDYTPFASGTNLKGYALLIGKEISKTALSTFIYGLTTYSLQPFPANPAPAEILNAPVSEYKPFENTEEFAIYVFLHRDKKLLMSTCNGKAIPKTSLRKN